MINRWSHYPLSTLMLAGIREILVISTPQDIPRFEQLLGSGVQWGLNLHYAIQPSPGGLAQAFIIGEAFIGNDSSALVLGDNIFYGHDFHQVLRLANHRRQGATIFAYHVKEPDCYGVVEFDHMLNIFGLEYKKFIKNSNMVKAMDSYLVMDYFNNTVHINKYDIIAFKSEDYFKHINDLLGDIGISTINSKTIRSTNIEYNTLISVLTAMYNTSETDPYTKLFKSDTNKIKHDLNKSSDLRKMVKTEIDNNPMVKYIMGTHRVTGQLRELGNKSPISNLSKSTSHYYGNNNDWLSQMNDTNVDLLRLQLSSLIK